MVIDKFEGPYTFLSNFYPCYLEINGKVYTSSEHAYQAAKTEDKEWRIRIMQAQTPGRAKRLGSQAPLREDWEDSKIAVMKGIVYLKFSQPQLMGQLLKTGDALLIEGNTWGDMFWGKVGGEGENHLGLILMDVRSMMRAYLTALHTLD